MYLKSLELHGFKSFPDKVKLEFDKGISAVVGPNGSGKSNIGDAMRWVMGEQSSKTLRGGRMEDVIFNGSKSRPRAGFAQVTLTIDNEDRALEVDTDIVSVSRKLYRNGDSEYMINGAPSRLKDIVELFMDTGLGRDGYSIIGQGKIADIVSSKSTERREIFEEAAGISKFRYKKEEAERKLSAAEDNIARLNDIMTELEDRIGPLEKQCEKAKKFRELDDEKRSLEISVWVHKLKELADSEKGYNDKLESLDVQYNTITEELDVLEDSIEDAFAMSAEKSAEVDQLRDKIHQTELDNSQAGAKIAVLENDIEHLSESVKQLEEQTEQSRSSEYFLETELKKRENDLKDAAERKEKLDLEIKADEEKLAGLQLQSEEFDREFADSNSGLNLLYLKKSELSFKLENAKNNLSEIQEGISAAADEMKDTQTKAKFTASELDNLTKSKNKTADLKNENQNKLAGLSKLFENRKEKLKAAEDKFLQNDVALKGIVQKLGLLRDLENSMEGFAYSVKHILQASKQGRVSGVCGSVAQLISVRPEYSVAIETALGGALQNIIVENEDAAKRGIRLLKESKAGRATFLPLTSVKGQRLSDVPENEEGFVALACDLAQFDKRYEGVINSLLGRVCVAENIDLATVIAKKYGYRFRIVTLDGQVINSGGSFTGGSVSKNTGILTRKNEIDALDRQRDKAQSENDRLKNEREKLSQEAAKLGADIDGVKEQLDSLSKDELRLDMEIKRVREYSEQYAEKLESVKQSMESLKDKLIATQQEIDETNSLLSDADKQIFDSEEKLANSQNRIDELKSQREQLMSRLSQQKMKSVELSKDEEACRLSIERLKTSLETNSDDSGRLKEKILENKQSIEEKRAEIVEINKAIDGSGEVIARINFSIEKAQREHSEYDLKANKLRSEQKLKTEEKETLSNEINRVSERKASCTTDFDKLVSRLWDEYELTRTEAEERAQKLDDVFEAGKRLSELRNKIKNLGSVNLGAIEEYAEVSQRYEFMKGQLDDVNTSKLELEELIYSLTENMKSMFTETFEKINRNFKEIFTELFGGGLGELSLTDSENVLECGIDIKVEPPGKLIKNLSLLSGGEQAFVAICIYFSILKISPSPFCLLDEIEAALDDVNVTKFAQYLHRFTDTTQFITITHRRGTMEEADVLYGVTMQEDGISKLLKMSMADTENMKLQ